MDAKEPKAITVHIDPNPLFSRVYVDGEPVKNVGNIRIDTNRGQTRISFETYPVVGGGPLVIEGYLVTKELADVYGKPKEIESMMYQAGVYRDLRDGRTSLSNGYGHKITSADVPPEPPLGIRAGE